MGFEDEFPWEEFYERYVNNGEEFDFKYKGKWISLSFGYKDGELVTALAYGTDEDYYELLYFKSPKEFLKKKIFDGKTLKEIWNELS